MNKLLYLKLALTNLKRNTMFPYLVSCVFTIAMYYIVSALSLNVGLKTISGGNFTRDVMKFGSYLFGFLSVVFFVLRQQLFN